MIVSDGVSPSPKEGPEPARPPVNPPLLSGNGGIRGMRWRILRNVDLHSVVQISVPFLRTSALPLVPVTCTRIARAGRDTC